jgi:hypothetical protein
VKAGVEERQRGQEPLRVGIDLTALLPTPTGVDTYLERLVGALAATDRQTRYTVFANAEDRRRLAATLPDNFEVLGRCLRPRPVRLCSSSCCCRRGRSRGASTSSTRRRSSCR